MMMNCFCGIVDWRKVLSFIYSRDHCQRSSPSRISDKTRTGFKPAQNTSSGLVEWNCAVAITTTPRHHGSSFYIGIKHPCTSKPISILRATLFKVVIKCKTFMSFSTFWALFLKIYIFEVTKFYLTKYQVSNQLNFFSGSLHL